MTDPKLYVPVAPLSAEENTQLLKKLDSGFKNINYGNKYPLKVTKQGRNQYLDFLITSFQGLNRLFTLLKTMRIE